VRVSLVSLVHLPLSASSDEQPASSLKIIALGDLLRFLCLISLDLGRAAVTDLISRVCGRRWGSNTELPRSSNTLVARGAFTAANTMDLDQTSIVIIGVLQDA